MPLEREAPSKASSKASVASSKSSKSSKSTLGDVTDYDTLKQFVDDHNAQGAKYLDATLAKRLVDKGISKHAIAKAFHINIKTVHNRLGDKKKK